MFEWERRHGPNLNPAHWEKHGVFKGNMVIYAENTLN